MQEELLLIYLARWERDPLDWYWSDTRWNVRVAWDDWGLEERLEMAEGKEYQSEEKESIRGQMDDKK